MKTLEKDNNTMNQHTAQYSQTRPYMFTWDGKDFLAWYDARERMICVHSPEYGVTIKDAMPYPNVEQFKVYSEMVGLRIIEEQESIFEIPEAVYYESH